MCHQSVGLIARHLESVGFPTTSLSSAWSITASANPPRTAFLNYPLGHTAGRPHQLQEQTAITAAALGLVHSASKPGTITPLDYTWPTDWQAKARELGDNRTERADTPQYERPEDEAAVTASS